MSDKPRDWWIHFTRNKQDETFVHDADPECDLSCEVIRVVDAKAYDALAAENERLRQEINALIIRIEGMVLSLKEYGQNIDVQFHIDWLELALKREGKK